MSTARPSASSLRSALASFGVLAVVAAGASAAPAVATPRPGQAPSVAPTVAPVAAPTATPAPDGDDASTLTLITGDRLSVSTGPDGRTAVTAEPAARPDGQQVGFHTFESGGHLFVIPSDIAAHVPDVFDRNLFDVTLLQQAGLADPAVAARMPVILDYDASAASRGRSPLSRATSLPGTHAERSLESIQAVSASVDTTQAQKFVPAVLAQGLERVWFDAPIEAMDLDSAPQIGAPQAWDAGFTGAGVTVAVLDTGIDTDHPDLTGKVVAAQDFSGSGDVDDHFGHGTHVASIVAGSGAASGGDIKGMAYGADLVNAKILDDGGNGELSWLVDGLEWAAGTEDADIVNLSIGVRGLYTDGTDPWAQAIDAAVTDHGTLVVVAAGNDGAPGVTTPGSSSLGLTVGAVNDDDVVTGFSGRGPRAGDWAIKPDLTAPGNEIIAARAGGTAMGNPVDANYTAASGTSMATPHVAGAAALLLQQRPTLTQDEVKSLLMGTAQPGAESIWDQGSGRIFVPNALAADVLAEPASLSFGRFAYPQDGLPVDSRTLTYRNLGDSDVTLQLSAELTDEDGAALPDGVVSLSATTVTVPAGGTGEVTVSVDPSASPIGLFGGAITAVDDQGREVRTAVGFYAEPQMGELVVEGTTRDGRPAFGISAVDVLDLDNASQTEHTLVPFVDGKATLRLPPGDYAVQAFIAEYDAPGVFAVGMSAMAEPEVSVAPGTTTVSLDAREAAPIRITADRPTESVEQVLSMMRGDVHGGSYTHSFTFPGDWKEYAGSTDPVSIGSFEFYAKSMLQAPRVTMATTSPVSGPVEAKYAQGSATLDGVLETEMVYVGLGKPEDYAGKDLTGKVALVRRGELTFFAKVQNAQAAGAAAVLIVNNVDGPFTVGAPPDSIPTLQAEKAEGDGLVALAQAGPVTVRLTGTPNAPYIYDVIFTESAVPDVDVLDYHADASNTVAITADYRAFSPDSPVGEVRHMWRPYDPFSFGTLRMHTAPVTRTEYVSSGDSWWAQHFYPYSTPASPFNGVMLSRSVQYPTAGAKLSEQWLHAAIRSGLKPWLGEAEAASVAREGDMLRLDGLSFTDDARHFTRPPANEDAFRMTLTSGNQVLLDQSGSGWAQVTGLPAGRASYRLVTEAEREAPWWTLSTRVRSEWRFSSAATGQASVLPLLDVHYGVRGLDDLNRATVRNTTLALDVHHQEGSTSSARVTDVRLWWSGDDGATWHPVKVKAKKGGYEAMVKAPNGTDFVSLKLQASDTAGSQVTQEIIRAYAGR